MTTEAAKPSAMQELATEALRKSIDVATQTGAFIEEQTPLVVQELVRWQIASNALLSALLLCIVVVWWWGGWRFIKRQPENTYNYERKYSTEWKFFGVPITVLCGGFGTSSTFYCLKWVVAPRVALIEYAAGLVR